MATDCFIVFIKTDKSLREVAKEVGRVTGLALLPSRLGFRESYTARLLSMDAEIIVSAGHGFVADGDLDFPSYQIDVHVGPIEYESNHDGPLLAVARKLAGHFSNDIGCATMVTEDVCRVIERLKGR
jgi:hypothetical protein